MGKREQQYRQALLNLARSLEELLLEEAPLVAIEPYIRNLNRAVDKLYPKTETIR
jgi:enamine deaminase RidA (YjgF/YER057c/UK114 family)